MSTIYFQPQFIEFFQGLELNNHKEWFDENRKTYEKSVKEPFKHFVQDVINEMNLINPKIQIEPKDAIFRINRDIRFSKDKTPYKLNLSAYIAPGGRKDKNNPGFYFELSAKHVRFYSGAYFIDKSQLSALRNYIIENKDTYQQIIESKNFKDVCNEILGEKNKRLDKDLMPYVDELPILWHKNIYYFKEYPANEILKEGLLSKIIQFYHKGYEFEQFLTTGMNANN